MCEKAGLLNGVKPKVLTFSWTDLAETPLPGVDTHAIGWNGPTREVCMKRFDTYRENYIHEASESHARSPQRVVKAAENRKELINLKN